MILHHRLVIFFEEGDIFRITIKHGSQLTYRVIPIYLNDRVVTKQTDHFFGSMA